MITKILLLCNDNNNFHRQDHINQNKKNATKEEYYLPDLRRRDGADIDTG